MTLLDLLKVYKCHNDLVVLDYKTNEPINLDTIIETLDDTTLNREVMGIRAFPIQKEEPHYFVSMDEMHFTLGAKVKVWVK